METDYQKLTKVRDALKEHYDSIENYKYEDYLENKEDIVRCYEDGETLPKKIRLAASGIDGLDLKKDELKRKAGRKQNILSKMNDLEDEVKKLIMTLKQKEKRFEGVQKEEENIKPKERKNSFGSKMKLLTLEKNSEVLEKRRKELEDIKMASSQVNQITEVMKQEVNVQQEQLNDIEANINTAFDNTEKAHKEIEDAAILQTHSRKKTLIIAAIVLGTVLAIIAIVICVYIGKKK